MIIGVKEVDVVEWIKAIGTIAIGILAAYVAIQAHQTNRNKLRFDLFAKRFALYNSLYESWASIMGNRENSIDFIDNVKIHREAYFLFDKETHKAISAFSSKLRDFHTESISLDRMNKAYSERGIERPERIPLIDKVMEMRKEQMKEIEKLEAALRPYLQFGVKVWVFRHSCG